MRKQLLVKNNGALKDYTVMCLLNNETFNIEDENVKTVRILFKKAKSYVDFKNMILEEDSLKRTQGYAEVSKEMSNHWYRVREMFSKADEFYKFASDAGSLKVGTNGFNVLISNGYGDGVTRVGIFKKDNRNFNMHMFPEHNSMVLNGKFDIYSYDCGNNIALTIDGNYFVYTYEGMIALVEY